jgi:hypothetical protein
VIRFNAIRTERYLLSLADIMAEKNIFLTNNRKFISTKCYKEACQSLQSAG